MVYSFNEVKTVSGSERGEILLIKASGKISRNTLVCCSQKRHSLALQCFEFLRESLAMENISWSLLLDDNPVYSCKVIHLPGCWAGANVARSHSCTYEGCVDRHLIAGVHDYKSTRNTFHIVASSGLLICYAKRVHMWSQTCNTYNN